MNLPAARDRVATQTLVLERSRRKARAQASYIAASSNTRTAKEQAARKTLAEPFTVAGDRTQTD